MILLYHAKRKRFRPLWTSALRWAACTAAFAAHFAVAPANGQQPPEARPSLSLAAPPHADAERAERKLLENLDAALERKQFAFTLDLIGKAPAGQRGLPAVCCRAAEARLGLGQALGKTAVRAVPGGRPGQFDGGWLLIEKRAAADSFLCVPPDSALVQVRRALDSGYDVPRVHLAHARVWLQAGRPETAWSILKAREAALLDEPAPDALEVFAEAALARGALDDYLTYSSRRAEQAPERRVEILHAAYLAAAERYNQRGDADLNRAMLRRALDLKADRPELMLQLADALWEAGEKRDAGGWYRRVIETQPAHPQRTRILERLGQ